MSGTNISQTVRRYYEAYVSKDRNEIEELLANDFVFSSPHDNRIDREPYVARCWPFAKEVEAFHIEKLFDSGNEAFVTYQCKPTARASFRNTEFFRVENGKVKEVVVYFGRGIEDGQPEPETETIRKLVNSRVEAVRARNAAEATALASSDFVLFDVVNPLRATGPEVPRRRAEEWFSTFDGPIGFEILDLRIAASCDAGFSHGLSHVRATTRDGRLLDMYWRWTAGYQKIDGHWRCTHEHNSVPFDTSTGKASLDLKP